MDLLTRSASEPALLKLATAARWLVFLSIAGLMLNVPLTNQLLITAVVLVACSTICWKSRHLLLKNQIVVVGLLLLALLTISITYSQGSSHIVWRSWAKYLKILYLFFFLPLFINDKTRKTAGLCLIATVMVSELFSWLHYFNIIDWGYPSLKHWLFVLDTDAGFVVSFVCYLLANKIMDEKKYRWIYVGCLLICSINILFLNIERTGYLIYLALTGLFLIQRFRWKGLLTAVLLVPLIVTTLYVSSHSHFHNRLNLVATNISDYKKGDPHTSIGLRLAFAEYSFKIIQKNWFLGAGVGSFEDNYIALHGPKMNEKAYPNDPHNEYIQIALQTGLIGLGIFLYWLYLQLRASFRLPQPEKWLLQGLILSFMLLSFCNVSLFVTPAGNVYIIFLAVFLAAGYDNRYQGVEKKLQ